ncbi:MAG TPA: hypothetical protein VF432_08110 [Thermoanaerobaculia bacterium]
MRWTYDWLISAPVQQFHLFQFDTAFRLSRWLAVPSGSGTSPGRWVGSPGRALPRH